MTTKNTQKQDAHLLFLLPIFSDNGEETHV